ncbi:TonB-dependent receptor [Rhodohalobacter sp. 614A]|uniref:TonB-dependent receptor n=1 Tax=Rhodohalobacter sp. 614A TaxID=2908649 RepID=UPI001F2A2DB2|nr:TonB-dependent receptor [Rhodohalobacter sp. 614A]
MKQPAFILSAFTAICLIVFGTGSVKAQNGFGIIEGTVQNSSGESLPGVHITISNLNIGTVSNSDGFFRMTSIPSGSHLLNFSMIGFEDYSETLSIQSGQTLSLEIELMPLIFQSDELFVTASRRSQLIGKVSVSINTVSPEELTSRNITSLDQALEYVPGVQVHGNSVNIRGSSGFSYGVGSRVLLLVDGVPLMGPDDGGMDFDGLPLVQTRQIEVLKSPGSALYGGGALGGVVNIITKDFSEQPENILRFYGGAYEPVRYGEWTSDWDGASDYRPQGGLIFGRSHQVSDSFGYWISGKIHADTGYLQQNSSKGFETYTKLGWNISDDINLSMYAGIRRNNNEQFLYWGGLGDVLVPGTISLTGNEATGANDGLSDRLTILPVFRHTVNKKVQYTIKGRLFGVAFRPLDDEGNIRPSDKHNKGIRYGGEAQINFQATDEMILSGGFSFDENVVDSDLFFGEDSLRVRSQPEGALFLQAEYNWSDRFTTTAGLRYDAYQVHTQETATQFSPKFSTSYSISDYVTARASFGKGFRVPSVAERFVTSSDFFPLESNLTLKPETSTGYEAGITYLGPFINSLSLKAELTGFWNEYRRLVEPTFVEELAAFQFVNVTKARIRGAEASVSLSTLDQNHQIRLGYTYLDATDLELNEPLLYRSEHLLNVSANSMVTSWLQSGIDFRAASPPERVDTDFSLFVPDADVFPAQYITDARLKFLLLNSESGPELNASFLVNNIFDYYYVERPAIFAPPRNFQIVIEAIF